MVTPTSLKGAGCAAAGLAASAVANNRAANTVVFIRYLPVEPNFRLGLPCEVNAISPRECGKASPGGIFLQCRRVARMESPGPAFGRPDDKLPCNPGLPSPRQHCSRITVRSIRATSQRANRRSRMKPVVRHHGAPEPRSGL